MVFPVSIGFWSWHVVQLDDFGFFSLRLVLLIPTGECLDKLDEF